MACIALDKNFDVRTLEILMIGTDKDIKNLIERNVKRFYDDNLLLNAENLDELNSLTTVYEQQLKEKIKTTRNRLASTDNGCELTNKETSDIFMQTILSVQSALDELETKFFFTDQIAEFIDDEFIYQKEVTNEHLSMFIDQYENDLDSKTANYMKKYIFTMVQHSYIFESDGKTYSLLVFLSFYEAYVKRIIGLTLIAFAKNNHSTLNAQLKSIINYVDAVTVPSVKSCYFIELQRWFKGEISEFIDRFMISPVDDIHKIKYQKSTLIDKKMLKSGKCSDIIDPPVEIVTPMIIDRFFLLSNSHYMIM